jgi:hypothetical protein
MKNRRLIHPLWTHLPILALIILLAIKIATAGALPGRAPTHFGFNGQPDGYGSPWLTFGLTFAMSLLFGVLSIVFDEIWARSEKHKSFNWISLFDELTAGFMVGLSLGYLSFLEKGVSTFTLPWGVILETTGAALALAVILEFLRPFRPNPEAVTHEDASGLENELQQRLRDNRPFLFWQSQNPRWVSILTVGLPLVMIAVAVVMWFNEVWFSLLYLAIAAAISLLYGGLRTIVTRESVTVRLGLLGLRVLKLSTAEIANAEIMEFSPIKDFGGYGIRFNGKMYAYFLSGRRGIKIRIGHGMQYLIGSDHPEQLLAVIKAVARGKRG